MKTTSKLYHLLPLALFFFCMVSCETNKKAPIVNVSVEELKKASEMYREEAFTVRRFRHADMVPLIEKRRDLFSKAVLGESVEGRDIYALDYGQGDTKVMLWSQMHGNESTATMAMFDLFNFLEAESDEFDEIRKTLSENLHIRFIPMVNPDGAERFVRRNAWEIDLNRDALLTTSPEAVILKEARDDFEPKFGFNLHDQNIYYTAKGSGNSAAISVLAPAYDKETNINMTRSNAMKVIVGMNQVLQAEVPGHVGKYDDAFEPRAFGDNFQKWGTSTILIESGGYPNDPEKQYIRTLNFMIILNALYQIATEGYTAYVEADYFAIPDNESRLMDLLIKQVKLDDTLSYQVDIGIRRREVEVTEPMDYYVSGSITDLGDLSIFYGYEEIDEPDLTLVQGKISEQVIDPEKWSMEEARELLRQGFIAVRADEKSAGKLHSYPILIVRKGQSIPFGTSLGSPTNFFLKKEENLKYAVVNGYLVNLENPEAKVWKQRIL